MRENDERMTNTTYQELLNRIEWQERRKEIIFRDCGQCQFCFSRNRLEVHHAYYDLTKMPWDYPDNSLLTLCHDCHAEETNLLKEYKNIKSSRKGSGNLVPAFGKRNG
jgi:hypothetical protein